VKCSRPVLPGGCRIAPAQALGIPLPHHTRSVKNRSRDRTSRSLWSRLRIGDLRNRPLAAAATAGSGLPVAMPVGNSKRFFHRLRKKDEL